MTTVTTSNTNANPLDALGLSVAQKSPAKSSSDLGQDDFLLLMTTQLRNQDPTQPMDNGAFLGQLAQFSTVSGIQKMQASFADLSNNLYTNQALLASSLVGRTVLVPSATLTLGEQGSVEGRISSDVGPNAQVAILDDQGKSVRTLTPSSDANGSTFQWDGLDASGKRAPAGTYAVQITSASGSQTSGLEIEQEVASVSLSRTGQSLQLNLINGQTVDLAQVQQIR